MFHKHHQSLSEYDLQPFPLAGSSCPCACPDSVTLGFSSALSSKHTPLNWHAHGQLSKHVWKIREGSLSIIPSMWTYQKCTAQMREKGKECVSRLKLMGQIVSSSQIYWVQPGGMFTKKMQVSPWLCGSSNLFNCLYLLRGSPCTEVQNTEHRLVRFVSICDMTFVPGAAYVLWERLMKAAVLQLRLPWRRFKCSLSFFALLNWRRDMISLLSSAETALICLFFVLALWVSICSFKGVQMIGKSESLYVLMRGSRRKVVRQQDKITT